MHCFSSFNSRRVKAVKLNFFFFIKRYNSFKKFNVQISKNYLLIDINMELCTLCTFFSKNSNSSLTYVVQFRYPIKFVIFVYVFELFINRNKYEIYVFRFAHFMRFFLKNIIINFYSSYNFVIQLHSLFLLYVFVLFCFNFSR